MYYRVFGLAAVFGLLLSMVQADSRDEMWKEVQQAEKKGLPKTAVEKLEPIITSAMKDKDYDEAVKAIAKKVSLQTPKSEERIEKLQAELDKAPAEMKPVMHAILAHWYWSYYQQNRWRFMQRTQTATQPGKDFTTWSLPRLFDEIASHYEAALKDPDKLKKIPVSEWNELLEKGTAPVSYRPTLYDFLAYEAIDFYASGEQAAAKSQDAFEVSAGSPIFSPVDVFLNWKPETTDEDSPTLKAIKLYQQLIAFHQKDDDKAALLDADLSRLEFGYNKAFGEEKNARYKAALEKFIDDHGDHEISARATHDWATVVHSEDDWVKARNIAQRGLNRHPNSIGGKRCYNLIQQIEAPQSQVHTERVWNKPLPTIDVSYRNLTKVYFRVVPFDYQEFVKSQRWSPESIDRNQREALLKKTAVKEWSHDLPKTEDYHQRTEEIPAPEGLKTGSYFLIASHNDQFSNNNNEVSFTEFWVSDLALVVRPRQGEGVLEGFVLNNLTGEPITGAEVETWHRDNRNRFVKGPATKTDDNGMFQFKGQRRNSVVLLAKHGEDALSSTNYFYINQYDTTPKPFERTVFFTDRALYRPGQTVHFKGICVSADHNQNEYEVIKGRNVVVVFSDVNGKEIEQLKLRTNDYGSFSGSVTAPRDRLMGQMSLRVKDGPDGYTSVRVEEYKRPKFRVEIKPPQEAPRLNQDVTVTAKATAYTGAAIDGAKVSWRVVREVRYPIWWYWRCWWMPPNQGASQEIAHGNTMTDANGSFKISFMAKPDPTVPEESEPTFQFKIYADVTDTTGETRSDQRVVSAGYTALKATMSAEDWQVEEEPVKITIKTTTLDGEGQPAKGTVKVYNLKQPEEVQRKSLSGNRYPYRRAGKLKPGEEPPTDPADPNSWPLGEVAFETKFETDATGTTTISAELKAGIYRAKLETQDRFGKEVTAVLPIQVFNRDAKNFNLKIPFLLAAPKWSLDPDEELTAIWGSGYETARAYIEVEHRGKLLQSFWTDPGVTQVAIKQEVQEDMRGGFFLRVTMVRENRAYLESRKIEVPWSNKELTVKWEHFVSKLKPGEQESWTAVVKGPKANEAVAELVAGLYDASLDAYLPHNWQSMFNVFFQDHSCVHSQFENTQKYLQTIYQNWNVGHKDATLTYWHFPSFITQMIQPYFMRELQSNAMPGAAMPMESADFANRADRGKSDGAPAAKRAMDKQSAGRGGGQPEPDLSNVSARKNLNETAFFYPHLTTGKDGSVRMEFTMPEALTEWKFLGFAHDKNLRGGLLTDKVVTAKELMVQPNAPRFVREGDVIEFTVKVSNQSATSQTGKVRLTLAQAVSGDSVDEQVGNTDTDKSFEIAAGASKSFSWRLEIPDGLGFLTYKAVGSTGRLSDGEEGYLPVLSRRVLVTESITLPIRGEQTKKFDFERLLNSGKSQTIEQKTLSVQMVSNPNWYAVLALPYLMEYPHQCTEQTFNRLYANTLARYIANSDPKIRRVFNVWKETGGDTLESPLEKNEDLKSLLLEETPWVRNAEAESQARRNVGILFDDNRLNQETTRLLGKLSDQQYEDGRWPWFPGGPGNDYITLYITTGFGRLRHLGVDVDVSPAVKSLNRLDQWVTEMYQRIPDKDRDKNHLSTLIAFYLYGRSFFLNDHPIGEKHQVAVNYWLDQAKEHWVKLGIRQSQGHLSLALKRFGDLETAKDITASLKERARVDEELGMYWPEDELSWWWYRAPIETQALMIEAFDEVANDQEAVEECRVWLIKQKQTQDWKTTKATADAVYALLLRGTNVLASNELVKVSLGKKTIEPEQVEAGTGYYQKRFVGGEIDPKMGQITVKKLDEGVAWGSVNWQYLEDLSQVTGYAGTPLKLTKELYVKKFTKKGPVLEKVDGPVTVGDELVVRVVLRTDRAMEYVHLKDYRGSGTEPVNVLSQYKYQDGLGYYESTRDTASHFFIDYLPKGTYVFEYSVRVQLEGKYQTGYASIQCMYAPEFNSHSESLELQVKSE